jgi:hypothetical protein
MTHQARHRGIEGDAGQTTQDRAVRSLLRRRLQGQTLVVECWKEKEERTDLEQENS